MCKRKDSCNLVVFYFKLRLCLFTTVVNEWILFTLLFVLDKFIETYCDLCFYFRIYLLRILLSWTSPSIYFIDSFIYSLVSCRTRSPSKNPIPPLEFAGEKNLPWTEKYLWWSLSIVMIKFIPDEQNYYIGSWKKNR